MAPVTGIPPTIGETMLATPWASNSAFELCRSPLIVSATTADKRLSTAASRATVSAAGSRGRIRSGRNAGMSIAGSPLGMPPNRDPIVSTGSPNRPTAAVAATTATMVPGTRGSNRGTSSTRPSEAAPRPSAAKLVVSRFEASAAMRAKNSLGESGSVRPRKSLIWVEAISTAMPFVNPSTTGRGMNLTACPRPVTARNTRITPAIIVTMRSPDRPCVAMMPATITTNAPVGPPIWMRDPPRSDTRNPPTMAV